MDLLARLGFDDPRPLLPVDRAAIESWLGVRLPRDYWESTGRGSVLIGGAIVLAGPVRAHFGMLPWTKHDIRAQLREAGFAPSRGPRPAPRTLARRT